MTTEKGQEGPMKSYLLIAILGLILCVCDRRRHSDEYDRGRFSGLKHDRLYLRQHQQAGRKP